MIEQAFKQNEFYAADIEEAAAWLDAVGLGHIADRVLDASHLVTDANLAKAVHEEGLTKRQYHTVQRRVETLRATVKSRKGRLGAGHQRPDCRDIFRDREVFPLIILTNSSMSTFVLFFNAGESQRRLERPVALRHARLPRLAQGVERKLAVESRGVTQVVVALQQPRG